jgi:hypothetical protein
VSHTIQEGIDDIRSPGGGDMLIVDKRGHGGFVPGSSDNQQRREND